ncbi:MAG: FAD-dependent oxidoreductase, partial [Propionibacterium sp.]|nr:FAD-dependent oxidoreductase [Propionibacterium sp.]
GTWDSPFWPSYPGMDVFDGEQLHTRNFWSADDYRGKRVVVVGGGSSAIQFLLQLDDAGAATTWVTRRPPVWRSAPFEDGWGRKVEDRVRARTEAGLLPESVVTATGLALTDEYQRGIEAGVLVSVGALRELSRDGIILDDGRFVPADVVLWATGFRHSIGHLAPLKLREAAGGIRTDGIRAARDPRVFMVGYGASASTLGATRAGRAAAVAVSQALTEARSTAA